MVVSLAYAGLLTMLAIGEGRRGGATTAVLFVLSAVSIFLTMTVMQVRRPDRPYFVVGGLIVTAAVLGGWYGSSEVNDAQRRMKHVAVGKDGTEYGIVRMGDRYSLVADDSGTVRVFRTEDFIRIFSPARKP